MNVQLTMQVSEKVTKHTSKDLMKTRLIQVLEEKKLECSPDSVKTTGGKFLELMTDVLNVAMLIGMHGKTLESRSLTIPNLFSKFSGYEKPGSHGNKHTPIEGCKAAYLQHESV